MKILIISDIHGDVDTLNTMLYKLEIEHIDKLIILGDFCSYFDDSIIIARILKNYKDKLICVRGNCDTDNFISSLDIDLPIYKNITINNIKITISHGHVYNPHYMANDHNNIFISGHTHRSNICKIDDVLCINPGSISRPRDGIKSYIIIDNDDLYIKDIKGNIIDSCNLNNIIV